MFRREFRDRIHAILQHPERAQHRAVYATEQQCQRRQYDQRADAHGHDGGHHLPPRQYRRGTAQLADSGVASPIGEEHSQQREAGRSLRYT